jgi:hypothetical protein
VSRPWKLKRTVQCDKCPWKKSTNPHEIPRGYSPEKHQKLESTIAPEFDPFKPGVLEDLVSGPLRIMACHDDHEAHCIGWLMNQMGDGNNIKLRLSVMNCTNFKEAKTVGPQHRTLEETLPKNA